jgi:ParB family chromosome partitioning protein
MHRLPLLNLPEDVLSALRSGRIEYTKAKAIASVKDEELRQQLLEDAIANSLSLSQIKEKVRAIRVTEGAAKRSLLFKPNNSGKTPRKGRN